MTGPPELPRLFAGLAEQGQHDPRHDTVRLAVRLRARDACEYCLMPTFGQFHVDHIIPLARWNDYAAGRLAPVRALLGRRGPNHLENFAWTCPFCNAAKGERTSIRIGGRTTRLFDPRGDVWQEHFMLLHNHLLVVGLSAIGRATERAMGFNDPRPGGPLAARHDAIVLGIYPPSWVRPRQ